MHPRVAFVSNSTMTSVRASLPFWALFAMAVHAAPQPIITPAPILPRDFSPTDFYHSVISGIGKEYSDVKSYVISGVPQYFQDLPTGDKVKLGYFTEWGVYGRNYHVKNLVTSGTAAKITHINYAFGNVKNGQCTVDDTYAAYDKAYTADQSDDEGWTLTF